MKNRNNIYSRQTMASRKCGRRLSILFCVALLLGWSTGGMADEDDDFDPRKNVIAMHDVDSDQYKKECKKCHSGVHSRTSLDPSILPAHRGMFPFAAGKPGSDKQCRWCHRTVNLVQGTQIKEKSLGNLRRHVDVRLCTLCHGPDRGPGEQYYQSGLSPTNPDGPLLYGLVCSGCHGALESSKVRGESARDIRKKIDEDEGGMGVLTVLTNQEIDALVAVLAEGDGGDDDDDDDDDDHHDDDDDDDDDDHHDDDDD
jgi:hypothetical protein